MALIINKKRHYVLPIPIFVTLIRNLVEEQAMEHHLINRDRQSKIKKLKNKNYDTFKS